MKGMMKRNRPIHSLTKHLKALHCDENISKQQHAPFKLTTDVSQIHEICYGNVDTVPNLDNADKIVHKLLDAKDDLFRTLAENIKYLEFDAKKQTSDVLNYVIRRCNKNRADQYIQAKTDRNGYNPIINALFAQYDQNMSSTIHEMAKRPEFTQMLLTQIRICNDNAFGNWLSQNREYKFQSNDFVSELFILAQHNCFNVASNAYQTLYQLLIHGNTKYVTQYLRHNFESVFCAINKLIKCDHFVTQKQFLILLRDLLTQPRNYEILVKYTGQKQNLAIVMNLMKKYQSNSLSLEAYHIFKLFVANPHKSKCVCVILWKNKTRLIKLLSTFHGDKVRDNPEFETERNLVIECVKNISLPNECLQSFSSK